MKIKYFTFFLLLSASINSACLAMDKDDIDSSKNSHQHKINDVKEEYSYSQVIVPIKSWLECLQKVVDEDSKTEEESRIKFFNLSSCVFPEFLPPQDLPEYKKYLLSKFIPELISAVKKKSLELRFQETEKLQKQTFTILLSIPDGVEEIPSKEKVTAILETLKVISFNPLFLDKNPKLHIFKQGMDHSLSVTLNDLQVAATEGDSCAEKLFVYLQNHNVLINKDIYPLHKKINFDRLSMNNIEEDISLRKKINSIFGIKEELPSKKQRIFDNVINALPSEKSVKDFKNLAESLDETYAILDKDKKDKKFFEATTTFLAKQVDSVKGELILAGQQINEMENSLTESSKKVTTFEEKIESTNKKIVEQKQEISYINTELNSEKKKRTSAEIQVEKNEKIIQEMTTKHEEENKSSGQKILKKKGKNTALKEEIEKLKQQLSDEQQDRSRIMFIFDAITKGIKENNTSSIVEKLKNT